MNSRDLRQIITNLVINELKKSGFSIIGDGRTVPVSVSARHIHVQREHLDLLFGENYELTVYKELSQPGQYAANERVKLKTKKGEIPNVRILGPVRNQTQVEITKSDAYLLGLDAEVRDSGDLQNTPGIMIEGPQGTLALTEGLIIADRHIHMTPRDTDVFQVRDGQKVSVKVRGAKPGILGNVTIRVSPNYSLDFHVDTDDANAFMLKTGDLLEIVK